MKTGNQMELEQEVFSCLQQSVPDGFTLRNTLSIERKQARKYRVVLYARSREDNTELKWRSGWITSGKPRGRDAIAEGIIISNVTAADWEAVRLHSSAYAPVESAQPRDSAATFRTAAPAIGSLREPSLAGSERSQDPNWGGQRDYSGRLKGSLGRAARRQRALLLRQELATAVPGAFNLSADSLAEVVRAWVEFEPEWAEEAKKKYLNKGTYNTSQAAKKLDMFTVLYPEHKPVGLFDWSSCHDCLEVGAPSTKKMNLGVGGVRNGEELAPMDPVTILEDTPNLPAGTIQHLVFRRGDDPPFHSPHLRPSEYIGKVKGMRQILWERGLLVKGMSKTGGSGEKQDLSKSMEHVLGEKKDFKEVDSSLVLLMERHGGGCLMLPKYHCECNPIELVWGRAKDWTRKNCTYSLECLRKNVPLSFRPERDRQAVRVVQGYCKRRTHTPSCTSRRM